MDAMTRSLVVKRDILTVSPPRRGLGVEMRNEYYDEDSHGKRDILTVRPPRQEVGMEMRNGCYDEEPRGKKRYPHRETSSSGGEGGDEKWML